MTKKPSSGSIAEPHDPDDNSDEQAAMERNPDLATGQQVLEPPPIPDSFRRGELMDRTDVGRELGLTRQRIHQLVQSGDLQPAMVLDSGQKLFFRPYIEWFKDLRRLPWRRKSAEKVSGPASNYH